jgi:hypothetical protein
MAFMASFMVGCAVSPGVPDRISIPVGVSCLPASGVPARPPIATDAELSGMDDFHLVLALRHNATRLADYVAELEAVLSACR